MNWPRCAPWTKSPLRTLPHHPSRVHIVTTTTLHALHSPSHVKVVVHQSLRPYPVVAFVIIGAGISFDRCGISWLPALASVLARILGDTEYYRGLAHKREMWEMEI